MHDERLRLIALARSRIGNTRYKIDATLEDAPSVVNCYRFVQWLWWHLFGIALPEHQLAWDGAMVVGMDALVIGDLVFARRWRMKPDDFGHVGIVSSPHTVIHASFRTGTVTEDPLDLFLEKGLLGARRIVP